MGWKWLCWLVAVFAFVETPDVEALTTNSWTLAGSGLWTNAADWSAGVAPTNTQSAILITNSATKTITINQTTPTGNLTISNLTIRGIGASTNTLFLLNTVTAGRRLDIIGRLNVLTNAALTVSNSTLQVDSVLGEDFVIDGAVLLDGGSINNSSSGGLTIIGQNGRGNLTLKNGTILSHELHLGAPSVGTLTLAGGSLTNNDLFIAGLGGTGTVWVTGGQLVNVNNATTIASAGVGQMTISNGTMSCSNIVVGGLAGSQGTLTIAGGTNQLNGSLVLGNSVGAASASATGTLRVTGGLLSMTNQQVLIGETFSRGSMTVTGGTVRVQAIVVAAGSNSEGTLTATGGTIELVGASAGGSLRLGTTGGPGTVWVTTSGRIVATNDSTVIGNAGPGTFVLSNGVLLAKDLTVGSSSFFAVGTLTVAGGTVAATGPLAITQGGGSASTVVVSGGRLVITNNPANVTSGTGFIVDGDVVMNRGALIATNVSTVIGNRGTGNVTVTGGALIARDVTVGELQGHATGTLTLAGGTNRVTSSLAIGLATSTGTVWLTGGLLLTTNANATVGQDNAGQMTVSNATWLARNIVVGSDVGSHGTLTIAAGTTTVSSNLTMGAVNCISTGTVIITGGTLAVTNAAGTAVLDIESGTLIQTGGTLIMDNLVITNPCARYIKTGGSFIIKTTLNYDPNGDADGDGMPNQYEIDNGLLLFNPNDAAEDKDGDGQSNLAEFLAGMSPTSSASSFRITSVAREGNNLRITWMTGIGRTNALQFTAGSAGSFATNGFTDLFTVTNTVGSVTNHLDIGGATNVPARYYRVRLVP